MIPSLHVIKLSLFNIIWARAWQNQQNDLCAQRRLRSAQSDQILCHLHEDSLAP